MDRVTQRAMMAWCAVVTLFGVALSGAGFATTDGFTRTALALLGHSGIEWSPPLRFAVALMGAVTMGWGLTIASVVSIGDRLPADAARLLWTLLLASVLAWFVVDSALSIATGFALNAVSNAVLLASLLAIVARGRLLRGG